MKNKFLFSTFVYFFILIFLSLGSWQLYRLNWKLDLIKSIDLSLKSKAIVFYGKNVSNFKKITFKGILDNSKIIYLYSLNDKGEPGFDILNPVDINNQNFLLNRGWIPLEMKSKKFDLEQTNFNGVLRLKPKYNYFKPNNDLSKNYWFTLKDEDLFKYTNKTFSKYIILNIDNQSANFPKNKKINSNISNNHLKYALTWFSLAISIFLVYLYFRKNNY